MLTILTDRRLVIKKNRIVEGEKKTSMYTVIVLGGTPIKSLPTPIKSLPLPPISRIELNPVLTQSTEVGEAELRIVSEEEKPPRAPKDSKLEKYNELIQWLRDLTGARIADVKKQYKWLKLARENGYEPQQLKDHAQKLWDSSFFRSHGMDWATVVQSIDKQAV